MLKRSFASGLAGVVLAAIAGSANADTLFLQPGQQQVPDISASNLVIKYSADSLSIDGDASLLTTSGGFFAVAGIDGFDPDFGDPIGTGTFHLVANIEAGGIATGANSELEIKGWVDGTAGYTTLVHSLSLLQFGLSDNELQFLFGSPSGSVSSATGQFAVRVLSQGGSFPDFTGAFDNTGVTVLPQADTFQVASAVPTPAAAAGGLALLGLAGVNRLVRRRRHGREA